MPGGAKPKILLGRWHMDLFNLISALNPSKVKTGLRPRAAHEVPLLTATASRVIDMEDPDVETKSSGTPSCIRSKPRGGGCCYGTPFEQKNAIEGTAATPRAKHDPIPIENVATMEVQDTHSAKSVRSGKSTSSPSMVGSPGGVYQPGWGVTNSCCLDTPDAFQDVVDHIVPPGYFFEFRHMPNTEFLSQYNKNLAQQVEKRCVEIDARLDALSIDFDEELYPHMLTAIAGRRWVIGHGLRLAVIKSGTWHRAWEGRRDLEVVEAYDLEANSKYLQALQDLKDLKYPIMDQLKGLKDAPMEVIMASLHLEIDSGEDAPKWICDLRPSTSQLKIPVYPEVRNPRDPWAVKEQMLLEEAIAANVSCGEKKKRCRVVCRTHEVGSAHHTRSDGVPVSLPTVAPQGIAILLADVATQTETSEDDASPRLLRSKSLPPMYNLDWP
nr:hypothetical protein [Tanacetum cinerariifolium]